MSFRDAYSDLIKDALSDVEPKELRSILAKIHKKMERAYERKDPCFLMEIVDAVLPALDRSIEDRAQQIDVDCKAGEKNPQCTRLELAKILVNSRFLVVLNDRHYTHLEHVGRAGATQMVSAILDMYENPLGAEWPMKAIQVGYPVCALIEDAKTLNRYLNGEKVLTPFTSDAAKYLVELERPLTRREVRAKLAEARC